MSFDRFYFSLLSNPPRTNCPNIWTYVTTDDTAAEVRASGYFDEEGLADGRLAVNDIIYAVSSDGEEWLNVTAITPAVTTEVATNTIGAGAVTTSKIADDAVTTAKIADDNVTTAKLADDSVTNAKLAEDTIQTVTVTVSSAELLDLAANPKELVAAPGADKFIQFLGAQLILDYNSAAYTEAGDNMGIKYTDASGVQVSETIESTGFIDQTADTITNAVPVKDAIVAASGAVNQALVLDNLGSEFAAGDSPMDVVVSYKVLTAGL